MKNIQPARRSKLLITRNINTGSEQAKSLKKILMQSIYPDDMKYFSSDSFMTAMETLEASKTMFNDQESLIDVTLFFVECGTQFLVDLGDIEEDFCVEIEDAFEGIVDCIKNSDAIIFEKYKERLYRINEMAHGSGFGHGDQIREILDEKFPGFLDSHSC